MFHLIRVELFMFMPTEINGLCEAMLRFDVVSDTKSLVTQWKSVRLLSERTLVRIQSGLLAVSSIAQGGSNYL
jgi:hypothetical protein